VKIKSNTELYRVVNEIADRLKEHDEREWVTRLHNALCISTVTGEILGHIKMELSALEEKRIARKLGLLEPINDALIYLASLTI
jgi:hypothetical protein